MKKCDLSKPEIESKSSAGMARTRSMQPVGANSDGKRGLSKLEFQNWLSNELERLEADFSDYVTSKSLMKDISSSPR